MQDGITAEKRELPCPRVGSIDTDVDEVVSEPEKRKLGPGQVVVPSKIPDEQGRQNYLHQRPTGQPYKMAEEVEEEVPGFVDDQVRRVKERVVSSIPEEVRARWK